MGLSVSIRPAVLLDVPAMNPLFEEIDEYHRVALPEIFRRPTGERRESSWLDWVIAGPDQAILVAEEAESQIIGLVVLIVRSAPATAVRDARQFVEIAELVVSSRVRRIGVGRSLIEASKTWARDRDIWNLEVSAWSFNTDTTEFYRKLGFQRISERFAMSSI